MESKERETQYYADIIAAMAERTIKRLWALCIVLALLLTATVGGFLWCLNQYDFESYELSTEGGGNANYIGNDWDIYNGESAGAEAR